MLSSGSQELPLCHGQLSRVFLLPPLPVPVSQQPLSYLSFLESLLHTDDLVVLVGHDGAQDADAVPVVLAEALQQFAVLGALPLSQNLGMAGLHQHMALAVLAVVFAQVGLAQRGLAAQARLHRGLRVLEAEIT